MRLRIAGTLAAGAAPSAPVGAGEAIRIMTGAPMPPGADAVVMVERTQASDDGTDVEISLEVAAGNHVRPVGDDVAPGDVVLRTGTVITPAVIGVLSSLGVAQVAAHPRPRVGVLSTGDELVVGPGPLAPGQIRDSNRPMLLALVAEAGCEPVDLGRALDDEAAIASAIEHAALECDALVTSGGVSMGDFDYVKAVLDRIGEMRWMQVAIKPAKPLAAGVVKGLPVFGLPGNPVSSLVSFELFARPALRRMMGHASLHRDVVRGVASAELRRHPDGKTHFARVVATVIDGVWRVAPVGGQGSHQLAAMASANALAVLADGDGVPAGGDVDLLLLG